MLKKILFLALVSIYFSCSQKFDGSGFSIIDPSQYPVTDTISIESKSVDSIYVANRYTQVDKKIYKELLYLGKVVDGADTLINLDILFAFSINAKDSLLDSAEVRFPIFNDSLPQFEDLDMSVSTINNLWKSVTTADSVDHRFTPLEDSCYSYRIENEENSSTFGKNDLVLTLPGDSIYNWYDNVINGGDSRYFYGLSLTSNTPLDTLFQLYSSEWKYYDLRPKVIKYFSSNSLDSTWIDTISISNDINIGKKMVNTTSENIVIDGFTGEGRVLKFNLDSIFEETGYDYGEIETISARLSINKIWDDPYFGGLENLGVYYIKDSLWYKEDLSKISFDIENPWQKAVADSGYTYVDIETFIDLWLSNKDKNFGIYIRSLSNKNPFSNSIFDKIKLEITYIKTEGEE
ncbi:MAG: hypothetical protein CR982_02615 [Candidatus Cloacimonadota bacterium]|nr:MAG: hypothetical protein CR982_02615 [Candidatus Cloacimonadota bacterium]PIE79322.1 MAG: hypothetical protein CSA15_03470 [Candidatus Delongbacteria bacterium]